MAIEILKLISSEEIIARVEADPANESNLIIKFPVIIAMTQDGIAMMPFLPYAEHPTTGLVISKNNVMLRTKPMKELSNDYQTKFVTGIVTPHLSLK